MGKIRKAKKAQRLFGKDFTDGTVKVQG